MADVMTHNWKNDWPRIFKLCREVQHVTRYMLRLSNFGKVKVTRLCKVSTRGSAITEGPRNALVSRNSATTKHPIWILESRAHRVTLFAWSYI